VGAIYASAVEWPGGPPLPIPQVRARPATSIFLMLELARAYQFNRSPREPCLWLVTE
jgi:hypothetical protein